MSKKNNRNQLCGACELGDKTTGELSEMLANETILSELEIGEEISYCAYGVTVMVRKTGKNYKVKVKLED